MEIELHMFFILSLDGALRYSLAKNLMEPQVHLDAMEKRKIKNRFTGTSSYSLIT
jgi:hypothetical protein